MKALLTFAIGILSLTSFGQSNKQTYNMSVAGGYGTQGILLRLDANVYELASGIPVKGYLEGNIKGKEFKESTLIFSEDTYSSDANRFMFGIGGALSFHYKNIYIEPYLGLRYYYVRFKDKYLVEGIGEQSLIRYSGGNKVGSTVENGYGDAISFDVGSWIGFRITPKVEIGTHIGFSPAKFDTANTLFGEYWGEYPISNDYQVKNNVGRLQVAISYHF